VRRHPPGTGFFIAPHLVVTNAHVVAGATSVTAAGATAQVALFDPVNDVAVLRVSTLLSTAPMSFATTAPSRGKGRGDRLPLDGTRTISLRSSAADHLGVEDL